MSFTNKPHAGHGEEVITRYVHAPLSIEHNGIQAQIKSNGKIVLTKVASTDGDTVEFDEIEIPATLVFRLGTLLRATRHTELYTLSGERIDSTRKDEEK